MILLLFVCFTLWVIWSVYSCFAYRYRTVAGKTVLIIGGSSPLGRCLVMQFLKLDTKVIVWDGDKGRLNRLAREFAPAVPTHDEEGACTPSDDALMNPTVGEMGAGERLLVNVVDLASRVQLQRAAKRLGPVHIIVNAAELCGSKPFFDRSDESSERILLNNVLCSIVLARAVLPGMLRQKDGHFVTITNAAGVMGVAKHPDYAASQWASVGVHESLQLLIREMGGRGKVRTTLCCPCSSFRGAVAASRLSTDGGQLVEDKEAPKSSTDSLPSFFSLWSRPTTPEEVAQSCIWAVCHGVERVYVPGTLVFLPLLRVLPVPWLMAMISSPAPGNPQPSW
ncbi:short-chain dehydrogenase [Trypanosoma conorhini]|uniref:Short-chain dehydrogenase n=1 Tax=Trypanosoma conorhini TaxID=83891 RepID=A0A422NCT3_9TRYP|nr:short-chain dehydrogenase [Trypanosoma conorhini]RNF03281.1 short-chain dehydrogenase [Trypanosoma conorhini]